MRYLLIAALTLCPLAWSEELDWIEAAKGNPERLVEEVRAYETRQRALAEENISAFRALAGDESASEQAQALRQKVVTHLARIQAAYARAVTVQPENAALINYQGEFLYDVMGEETEGVRLWQEAVALDDTLALAHNNLGIHFFHVGKYEAGLEHLDRALKLDREHPDFLYNMAQMYLTHTPQIAELRGWREEKVYNKAMKLSRKAAELAPDDYELYKDYAMNFFGAERFDAKPDWKDAARAWEKARAAAPTKTDTFYTWINEGRVWIAAGEDAEAVRCLEQAVALDSTSTAAAHLLEGARSRLEEKKN